ncbi:MAG TPA: hypothetical protein VFC05_07295 [Nitrososphaeraceae archaeon]|jgi:hypothetical protein|nr:hypothetical protein [Nitrososphaeraceae archaeon]
MNFDYSKRSNNIIRVNTTIVLIVLAAISLIIYYSLSILYIPQLYLSFSSEVKSQPVITGTKLSNSKVILGESFDLTITTRNHGDTADMQVVSLSFPNITSIDSIVKISDYNFTQKPVFIKVGDAVGSEYYGFDKVINAPYPSIEANSRPWHTGDYYQISIDVKPTSVGRFVIFSKTIALPHINELDHYPRFGIKDYQGEFIAVSAVDVVNK